MVVIDCIQGSEAWLKLRLGLVSASRFKDIMTNPRSKTELFSATAKSYMLELIAEILTGEQKEVSGKALEWGSNNEINAQNEYAFEKGVKVESVGICLTDDKLIGASPDGFVGDDGMIEIKSPYNSANHIATVIANEMPKEHMAQIQGNLMVNGRGWCDFISYDPRINNAGRLFVSRVYRDDEYIDALKSKIDIFISEMKRILLDNFNTRWEGVDL